MSLQVIWKDLRSYHSKEITLENNTIVVTGWYTEGEPETPLSGGGATAPTKPSFEIESILLVLRQPNGQIMHLSITKLLEDINSITWRKDCYNDLFDYLEQIMIKHYEE